MMAVNAKVGRVAMGDRTSGLVAPIDKFNKDRMGKRERVRMVQGKNRGVQERVIGTRINQRTDADGREAWHQELHQEREVAGKGVGEGKREGKYAVQPGPY